MDQAQIIARRANCSAQSVNSAVHCSDVL